MLIRHIQTAANSLYAAKQRTLLALLGMSIGIASVIAMLSVGLMYGTETMRQYEALGSDLLRITYQQEDNEGRKQDKNRKQPEMRVDLVQHLPEFVPGVIDAAPRARQWGGRYAFKGKQGYFYDFIGTTPSYQGIKDLRLQEGRFISDLDDGQRTVVISSDLLDRPEFLLHKNDIIGMPIMIQWNEYRIVGVLSGDAGRGTEGASLEQTMITHISNIKPWRNRPLVQEVRARLAPDADSAETALQIEAYFARRVRDLKVDVSFAKSLIERKQKQANMQTLLLSVIGGIAMLVAGVGIMNVMLTSVTERRQEIGILRAIGARQSDIRWQFFIEAIILSLIGGIIGTLLGVAAAYGYADMQELEFFVSGFAIAVGVGVSTLIGIIFGLYPAHKAAKLDPITALRSV